MQLTLQPSPKAAAIATALQSKKHFTFYRFPLTFQLNGQT